jgi:hypothetical protein
VSCYECREVWVSIMQSAYTLLVLSSLSHRDLQYIFPYFVNGTIFEKQKLLNTKCLFWFSVLPCLKHFLFYKITDEDIVINMKRCLCKVTFVIDINETLIFTADFFAKYSNIRFHDNPSSGEPSCFMRTDRQTDIKNLMAAFRSSSNALNIEWNVWKCDFI